MIVTSIRYQPVEGGTLGGHLALHVTLGVEADPGVSFSPNTLSEKIHDCFEELNLKSKSIRGVLIDCRRAIITSDDMISLLGTLRDWSYTVVLWVSEKTRYPWFELASYITVFVISRSWANFKVNEIRYLAPNIGSPWTEPEIYDVNANVPSYLVVGSCANVDILAFITEAKRPWGLVIPAVKSPSISFKLAEDA